VFAARLLPVATASSCLNTSYCERQLALKNRGEDEKPRQKREPGQAECSAGVNGGGYATSNGIALDHKRRRMLKPRDNAPDYL
jgi:hypothetical protein